MYDEFKISNKWNRKRLNLLIINDKSIYFKIYTLFCCLSELKLKNNYKIA